MLIYTGYLSENTVLGEASVNTQSIRGLCRHVIVKPATETTTYDISITNPVDAKIYERTSETGTLSELTSIPIQGTYTINITNATADETFIVELICEE